MDHPLGQITPQRLTGNEPLPKGVTLLHFWQWMGSDLMSNTLRGALGEYLVALAVGAADARDGVQEEWAPYDVQSPDGVKIEVKTSAYIQTWEQPQFSTPQFDIEPKKAPDSATNSWTAEKKRWSDVYVFCLHHHQDQPTINPLDLSQWTFYVLPAATLDRTVGDQKSIRISSLQRIGAQAVTFDGLRPAIAAAYNDGKSASNINPAAATRSFK